MRKTNNQLLGSAYILISALFYGSYGIWSRLMVPRFGEFSQAWTRGLFLLVVLLLLNLKLRFLKKIEKKDMGWFAVIAMAGGLNQAPYYFGFEHLNIGTATLLFYGALVVGGYLLGKIFFAEKMVGVKMVSLIIALLGMLAIFGFSLSPDQILPASLTILAGLMGASAVVLSKKLIGNYHELQIMIGYFALQVIINAPLSLLMNNPVPALALNTAWMAQLGYAISMLVANVAVIKGFSHLEPSIGSLIGLVEILFGVIFGVLLFGETIGMGMIIGGILIIVAAALPSVSDLIKKS